MAVTRALLKIVLSILGSMYQFFVWSWVIQKLYGWFISPAFSVPIATYRQCMGFMAVAIILTLFYKIDPKFFYKDYKEPKIDWTKRILFPIIVLFMFWLIHLTHKTFFYDTQTSPLLYFRNSLRYTDSTSNTNLFFWLYNYAYVQ